MNKIFQKKMYSTPMVVKNFVYKSILYQLSYQDTDKIIPSNVLVFISVYENNRKNVEYIMEYDERYNTIKFPIFQKNNDHISNLSVKSYNIIKDLSHFMTDIFLRIKKSKPEYGNIQVNDKSILYEPEEFIKINQFVNDLERESRNYKIENLIE